MRQICTRIIHRNCSSSSIGDRIQLETHLQALNSSSNRELTPIWYASLLQLCGKLKALPEGRYVQAELERNPSLKCNIFLWNHLVTMYSKCGRIEEARREFDRMQTKNVFSWTAIISAYAHNGRNILALEMFKKMMHEQVVPDKVTLATALNACANLGRLADGKWIHQLAHHVDHDFIVGNSIVDMYGKCGNIPEAQQAFDRIQNRNSVCWTSIIGAYVRNGRAQEAWLHYCGMQLEGIKPDKVTFVTLLGSADNVVNKEVSDLVYEQGALLHSHVVESELDSEQGISGGLLRIYSRVGRFKEAKQVFDRMNKRDIQAWNFLLAAFAHKGHSHAIRVFKWMQQLNVVKPNRETFIIILETLGKARDLKQGRMIHEAVEKAGLGDDSGICLALVKMYGSCGSPEDALQVFEKTPGREYKTEVWDAMLAAYTQQGHGWKAYKLFKMMLFECKSPPGAATFVAIFDACARLGLPQEARIINGCFAGDMSNVRIAREGPVACSLINMFIKCDMLINARRVFNTMQDKRWLPAWNSMMGALVHTKDCEWQVIKLFRQMQVEGDPKPNKFTYISVLHACAKAHTLVGGLAVRECLIDNESVRDEDGLVTNALINVYNFCSDDSHRQHLVYLSTLPRKISPVVQAKRRKIAALQAFREAYVPILRKHKIREKQCHRRRPRRGFQDVKYS